MLERFFKTDSTPRRLRSGPAGPFLDGFAESMCAGGYSSEDESAPTCTPPITWASGPRGAASPIADLDEDLLARFVRHLRRCRCRGCKRGGAQARALPGPRVPAVPPRQQAS